MKLILNLIVALALPIVSTAQTVSIPTAGPSATPSPVTPTTNVCGVIATMIYAQVEGAQWREIVALKGTFQDGRKFQHMAAVWQPMKDSNVLLYDASYGTFMLHTKATDKQFILDAIRQLWPKLKFDEIHFLDDK